MKIPDVYYIIPEIFKYAIVIIWARRIIGIPILNCGDCILWRHIYIATNPPIVQPINERPNKTISLILHLPFIALILSIAKNKCNNIYDYQIPYQINMIIIKIYKIFPEYIASWSAYYNVTTSAKNSGFIPSPPCL